MNGIASGTQETSDTSFLLKFTELLPMLWLLPYSEDRWRVHPVLPGLTVSQGNAIAVVTDHNL